MPDPHLKQCMAEIKKLLKRYRIGGAITLVSKSHAEFMYELSHWCVIQPEADAQGRAMFRVRSFKEYYGNKKLQQQEFEESLHCILQMRDIGAQTFDMMEQIREFIEKAGFEITHTPFSGFEPHEEE